MAGSKPFGQDNTARGVLLCGGGCLYSAKSYRSAGYLEIKWMNNNGKPPKMKDDPYSHNSWITHSLWCNYRRHRRSSALCPRCREREGCTQLARNEYRLRRQRSKYYLAAWGGQRRLLPEDTMTVSKKADDY